MNIDDSQLQNSFEFMTSQEVAYTLAKKIQKKRKKKFKTQALFAKHIGMSHGTYARFEKSGEVSFVGFIKILKGLEFVGELSELFDEHEEIITW